MHRDRLIRIFQPRRWERLPHGYLLEESRFDPVESAMENAVIYLRDEGEPQEWPYELRIYTSTELIEMAQEAGFEEIACYGGFEREELSPDTRLVLVAG